MLKIWKFSENRRLGIYHAQDTFYIKFEVTKVKVKLQFLASSAGITEVAKR